MAASVAPFLMSWYSQINAKYLDLVGDYAGKERFFIEGDSLLLECFSNPQLDFSPGFQVLHAVYLVEQYLQNLLKRGCVFDVVFFHQHEQHCLPRNASHPARYLLTRQIIITHLRKYATLINVFRFQSLEDALFEEYLQNSAAYFALCSDGARYKPKDLENLNLQAYVDGKQRNIGHSDLRTRLRAMIFRLEQHGLDIALLNGLTCQDSKVFTFVLESASRHARHAAQITKEISLIKKMMTSGGLPLQNDSAYTDAQEQLVSAARLLLISGGFKAPSSRLLSTISVLHAIAKESDLVPLVPACLAQAILLELTPLANRAVVTVRFGETAEELCCKFIDSFSRSCLQVRSQLVNTLPADSSAADMFDGRLFRITLSDYFRSISALPKSCRQGVLPGLIEIVSGLKVGIESGLEEFEVSLHSAPSRIDTVPALPPSILPFSHPAFDEHFSVVNFCSSDACSAPPASGELHLIKFSNRKRHPQPFGKSHRPEDARAKQKILRSQQRFMAEMTSYAASLTNANGKILKPELIIVADQPKDGAKTKVNRVRGEFDTRLMPKSKTGSNPKKPAPLSVRGKIAAEAAQLSQKREDIIFSAWKNARERIDLETDLEKKYILVAAHARDVSGRKDLHTISDEIEFFRVSVLVYIWADYCRKGQQNHGLHIAVLVYDGLLRLVSSKHITKAVYEAVTQIAMLCGMKIPKKHCAGGRALSFQFPIITDVSIKIQFDALEFQLMHMGPYLIRATDEKEDSRVTFSPDAWQRQVLDELDRNHSVLVVAPTSSGKTFISFYAMERVLRASDDGVIVYIAPTKALVNQIAAEIQARFTKNYEYAGTSVYAISTRDYRVNNPKQCQVLVTVPHLLQIMLMSPGNKSWVPKIKTIILDEVHTIGQAEDGLVWEQLLLMAPCQVVALSATVGNPQAFASWLSSAQSAVGRTSNLIEHEHRFSDLRKYVFEAPESFTFSGLPEKPIVAPLGLENIEALKFLHPICCLSHPQRGIPDDLALESRDCLLLWNAMKKFETEKHSVSDSLTPSTFFPDASVVKSDVIRWATELKQTLSTWMGDAMSPFREVIAELSNGLPSVERSRANNHGDLPESSVESHNNDILNSTLPLLCNLHSGNGLPAILFNFNRTACEDIVRYLRDQLSEAEARFKQTDLAWKAKIARFSIWKKLSQAEKLAKKKDTGKKSKKASGEERDEQRGSGSGRDEDTISSDGVHLESFDPDAPLQKFSFADPKKGDAQELAKIINRFKWAEVDQKLIDAFQRGIAVHHSGMNRKYRQAVEIWFRRGFLTVVVATATLSLGINMPCKTVVFSGDSVYLTALNYRQSAGRSGRRGFDLLGNVVFQNISTQRACRLLSSRLPDLNGHFPLTTNFVLRLLALLHGTSNAPYAMQMVNSLLSQPRLYLGGESFKHEVLHHVRFSIEYLRSQGLIGAGGEPLNFARCICNLSSEENSAFAMHALLRYGYFHDLAQGLVAHEEATLRTLVLVLANLFGRRAMRSVDSETQLSSIRASSSVVFLPVMPDGATKMLKAHDEQTLETYVTYVNTFIEQHCKDPDDRLPLTKIAIRVPESEHSVTRNVHTRTSLRSPFVALSGHDDHFESISDLCGSVRGGVFLEKAVIPHLEVGDELHVPLNAYIYDFYQHGNVDALVSANRIQRGDIWYYLNDFSLVLATIVASLENLIKNDDTGDIDMTDVGALGDEIEMEFDARNDEGDDEDMDDAKGLGIDIRATAIPSVFNTTKPQLSINHGNMAAKPGKNKKKAVVAESWDDSDSDSGADGGVAGESTAQGIGFTKVEDKKFVEQEEKRLKMVYLMFKKLRTEFDAKFRKMWA